MASWGTFTPSSRFDHVLHGCEASIASPEDCQLLLRRQRGIPRRPKPPNRHPGDVPERRAANVPRCGLHASGAKLRQFFRQDVGESFGILEKPCPRRRPAITADEDRIDDGRTCPVYMDRAAHLRWARQ